MDRRQFLGLTAGLASLKSVPSAWANNTAPEIAFTFDDPTTEGGANLAWQEVNDRILKTLANHNLKGVLFVCGKRVDSEAGRNSIAAWDRAGHGIANHSYSHLNFNSNIDNEPAGSRTVSLTGFESDALRNEPLIRGYSHFVSLFRYPFFKEGDTWRNVMACGLFCGSTAIALAAQPSTLRTGPLTVGFRRVSRKIPMPISRATVISIFSTSGSARNSTIPSACAFSERPFGTQWYSITARSMPCFWTT